MPAEQVVSLTEARTASRMMVRLEKEELPLELDRMVVERGILTPLIRAEPVVVVAVAAMTDRLVRPKPAVGEAVADTQVAEEEVVLPATAPATRAQEDLVGRRTWLEEVAAARLEMPGAVLARMQEARQLMPG